MILFIAAVIVRWCQRERWGGDSWIEIILSVMMLAPAIVLAVGARSSWSRSAVIPLAIVLTLGGALLTFAHFALLSPIVDGGSTATRLARPWGELLSSIRVDPLRLALGLAAFVVVPLVALVRRARATEHASGSHRRTRVVALSATFASAVALLLAAGRAGSPSPAHYLSTLEPSVRFEEHRAFYLGGSEYRIEMVPHPVLTDRWAMANLPDHERGPGCVLVGPAGTIPLGNLLYPEMSSDRPCKLGWDSKSSAGLGHAESALYVDRRGDYAVLYQPMCTGPYVANTFARLDPVSAPSLADGCSTYGLALRVSDGQRVTLDARLLADRLGPPLAMIATAGSGLFVALSLLVVAARARRRARSIEGQDARHEGQGVVIVDGTAVHVAAARTLPAGAVLLSNESTEDSTAFRDRARFDHAEAGTRASIRAPHLLRAATLETAAFAVALTTSAPLIAAHAAGL